MPEEASIVAGCAIAGCIGLVWGLGEIIGAFRNEIGHALRTWGAWMLMAVNALAAAAIFFIIASLIPGANNWLSAVVIGFAWPTVIRNSSFKLTQPIQPDQAQEAATVRFEHLYRSVQDLAQHLINNSLTQQRMEMVTAATEYDLDELERFARVTLIASPLQAGQGMPAQEFIDQIMAGETQNHIKKAFLAAFILLNFGRKALDDFLRQQRAKKEKKPA